MFFGALLACVAPGGKDSTATPVATDTDVDTDADTDGDADTDADTDTDTGPLGKGEVRVTVTVVDAADGAPLVGVQVGGETTSASGTVSLVLFVDDVNRVQLTSAGHPDTRLMVQGGYSSLLPAFPVVSTDTLAEAAGVAEVEPGGGNLALAVVRWDGAEFVPAVDVVPVLESTRGSAYQAAVARVSGGWAPGIQPAADGGGLVLYLGLAAHTRLTMPPTCLAWAGLYKDMYPRDVDVAAAVEEWLWVCD